MAASSVKIPDAHRCVLVWVLCVVIALTFPFNGRSRELWDTTRKAEAPQTQLFATQTLHQTGSYPWADGPNHYMTSGGLTV
ncbi:hypothetical protein ES288_D06G264600v1 [Gossypium darwinii]|uniref:Uncharacterized protein n=2 Tax=Gossypium TaxID=3633 RepID=A0A5D2KR56_GOSTO|nr:hypothetical protein ES288_D06G264600v1 [Gossypium darwinii]TYH68563.1 hypothetical protein ES332_D06G268900v1 [Gossypium tomentosum]